MTIITWDRLRRLVLAALISIYPALALAKAGADRQRIWIDTDAACVPAFATDVDDCWALAFLIREPAFEIAGISSVFGNRDRAPSRSEVRTFLSAAGLDPSASQRVEVFVGAGSAHHQSDGQTAAAGALIAALEVAPMTILALGPLTNLASALERRPDLVGRVDRIVAVAGQRAGDWFFPGKSRLFHVHDMNFRKDVRAFQLILSLDVPLTLVPYAAGSQVVVGKRELDRLERGLPHVRWLADISRQWLDFWETSFRSPGFFPFDLVAAGHLRFPGSLKCRRTLAHIVTRHSLFTIRDTLEVDADEGREVLFCDRVSPRLWDQLLDHIESRRRHSEYFRASREMQRVGLE